MRRCAGFGAVLWAANRDERPVDLFGKLKADVRVTTLTRKRRAAKALRILFVTRCEFARRAIYLSSRKTCHVRGRALSDGFTQLLTTICGIALLISSH